jgi:hypothetical protein
MDVTMLRRLSRSTSMRIVIVDTYYAGFQRQYRAAFPAAEELPYGPQRDALLARFFGTFDAYSHGLGRLGHDAQELLANVEPLQRRWAQEHGVRWRRRHPLQHVLAEQVAAIDPQVVYVQDMAWVPRRLLDSWRAAGRLVVGQIAVAPPAQRLLEGYDLIVTSFPHYPSRFRALGVESEYLPLAFDPRVLDGLPAQAPRWGTVFVGGLDPRVHVHGTRLIERIAQPLDLQLWGYGLPERSSLRSRYHGELWGRDMYEVLAASGIVVNRHIEAAEGHANNMRLFEATGSGAALVTEAADNLADLFEPGVEVATYRTPEELIQVVRGLVEDDDRRRELAAAGQARTLRDHGYGERMAALAAVLESRLG